MRLKQTDSSAANIARVGFYKNGEMTTDFTDDTDKKNIREIRVLRGERSDS